MRKYADPGNVKVNECLELDRYLKLHNFTYRKNAFAWFFSGANKTKIMRTPHRELLISSLTL